MPRRLILAAALAAAASASLAQTAADLQMQANMAFASRDYVRAGTLLEQSFERQPQPAQLYNAACAYALGGHKEQAMRTLQRALANGFFNATLAGKDSDLASLHGDPRWPALLEQMKQKEVLEARLFNSAALRSPYRDDLPEDEKVAGLSKFWSEVKYNFVYTDRLKELDWDKLYLETLPKVRATTSTAEYYRVLIQLGAKLRDGHTGIWGADELLNKDWAKPLLKTRLVEGKVVVDAVFDPDLVARGVARGTEITAVDGEPVKAWAEREIRPYVSASSEQDMNQRVYGYQFLQGPVDVAPRVSFRTAAGKAFDAPVRRVSFQEFGKLAPKTEAFELRMLPGNIAYVALNTFNNSKAADGFLAAFDQIAKSQALIIDVRNNGGGNSGEGYRVLSTLTDKTYVPGKWGTRDYRPTYRAWQMANPDHEELDTPRAPDTAHQYSKPVVVLTSARTYSAAEDFALAFDIMQRGQIIGEVTGGSTGQPLFFDLPGGGHARICTRSVTYPDGRVWIGKGIAPNVAVAPTVADIRKGRDTVLEAALAALRK